MFKLFKVFVCFIACQLYLSRAQGSALPLTGLREGKLNSGETEEQGDYQPEHGDSQERQLRESAERQYQSRQLKNQQIQRDEQEEEEEEPQGSEEQNKSQSQTSHEAIEQRDDSQEPVLLKRNHSQQEEEEDEEQEEEQAGRKKQKTRQTLQKLKQQNLQVVKDSPGDVNETSQSGQFVEENLQQLVQNLQNQDYEKIEGMQDEEMQEVTKDLEDSDAVETTPPTQNQESLILSQEDPQNKTESKEVIPENNNQTDIQELQEVSPSRPPLQHLEEDPQQTPVDQETQETSSEPTDLKQLEQNTSEQQSQIQTPLEPEREENDLQGQPSKQQNQFLAHPLETQRLQSRPDAEVETQIPPPKATDLQSGENTTDIEKDDHNESNMLKSGEAQNESKSEDPLSKEDEPIQSAATEQQAFIHPSIMITPMSHPNITRPYALRRVNFSRNVTGMEHAEESRTLLKAALGLLTGLNMDTNNFDHNIPTTGKFTASNTMSFLGKIFNTDFSISYGTPTSTHVTSLHPQAQVLYSPSMQMGHHLPVAVPVAYSPPLSIGHSQYYDRQYKPDEYITFPPYGKPLSDNVNWHRKPDFVPSNGPHSQLQQLGNPQQLHELHIPEQTQLHQQQEQYQLHQQFQDQPQHHHQPEQHKLNHQLEQQEQHQLHQQLQDQLQHHQKPELHHLNHHLEQQEHHPQQPDLHSLQHQLEQQGQHQPQEQYELEQHEQQQQHPLQHQHEEHQQPEFFKSDSTAHGYSTYETIVDDVPHSDASEQPESNTTETPSSSSLSKSEEKGDSDVKQDLTSQPEYQDSSKTEQDSDRSLAHDSREVSIDSDQYVDEGSFSEEEVVRKKEKKRKRNKGHRNHYHRRRHSRPDRRSDRGDSNESNFGSEDTRYRSSEDSWERYERNLGHSGETRS